MRGHSSRKLGLSEAAGGLRPGDNCHVDPRQARAMARATFVRDDNTYGCAETAYVVLKHAFGLPDPEDSSPAMALNGGVAYEGGVCGAMTGAGLAVGQLAAQRIPDHAAAKGVTRRLLRLVMEDFRREFGSVDCRELIEFDLRKPGEHERFIDSGIWRTRCASQVEYAVGRLAELADGDKWNAAVNELGLGDSGERMKDG